MSDFKYEETMEQPFVNLVLGTTNNNIVIENYKKFRITGPTEEFTISGITGGTDGREILLYNSVAFKMTINNDSANSSAANRILTLSGGDFQTTTVGSVTLIYDGAASRWIFKGSIA